MTIKEAITKGAIDLKVNNIETPKTKARMLMQFVMDKTRQYIIVNDGQTVEKNIEKKYFDGIEKLKRGIPIEHITNQKEFMKLNFFVNENVLIPRQDTEILVEEVIQIVNKKFKNFKNINILDLCTGSGAIAVSLAKYISNSEITALDISYKALEIANYNAKKNNVEERITFVESNLFEKLPKEKYDIIVSNPPYIRKDFIKKLDINVRQEPEIALNGGIDGLDFYRRIAKNAVEYLKYNSYLCFEIGYDQKEDVIDILKKEEKYTEIYSKKDLCDNDRIVIAKVGD